MVETVFDNDDRIRYVSLVSPLSIEEHAALLKAMQAWKNHPMVWSHNPPEVKIIQLHGRWEPDIEDTP